MFWGGGGNDSIFAGGGSDIIDGGFGFDLLEGGDGADIFVFTRPFLSSSAITEVDTILDFGFGGSDKIDLRSYGTLNSNDLQIINSGDRTNVYVHAQNFTQQIVLERPIDGPVTLDDFIFNGFSNPQTNFFDVFAITFNVS
jgi:Ca2+-binding RTX toxin-like protein